MAETDLKHCPFCNGEAETGKGGKGFYVFCPHCGSVTKGFATLQEAVAAWNARPIEYAQAAEISGLRSELEEIARGHDTEGMLYSRDGLMKAAREALEEVAK